MIQELATATGSVVLAIVVMLLGIALFAGIAWRLWRRPRAELERMRRLPLDDAPGTGGEDDQGGR